MRRAALLLVLAGLAGCHESNSTYTLYRSSPFGVGARIHMATFDAKDSNPTYNAENCRITADLFSKQTKAANYWCEPRKFHE